MMKEEKNRTQWESNRAQSHPYFIISHKAETDAGDLTAAFLQGDAKQGTILRELICAGFDRPPVNYAGSTPPTCSSVQVYET